jgi:hypothetical protein
MPLMDEDQLADGAVLGPGPAPKPSLLPAACEQSMILEAFDNE